ncbi:hypothetical protein [Flavobacterium yafengii]|uniref:hypothetical protein n=1 Tax=Flavobacterium yafengii TaxID=3041253 RepID=UPI0024A8A55E|nr:hypothetical protein [Flavobacterium yafengii]MDI5899442.1 hypothetical protein [Flavobacterium yafengii]
MNIVEKEACFFVDSFFECKGRQFCNIDSLKRNLSSKLYNFTREKDKLFFLNVLRNAVKIQKEEHEKTCTTTPEKCNFSLEQETAMFVIDQEIEIISKSYEFQPKKEDEFESAERAQLHNKLNDIIKQLKTLGYGQEIIFNEIDELKENFNLGKKNWFQLTKGKFFDLAVSKLVEETLLKEMYSELSENFKDLPKLIDNLQ